MATSAFEDSKIGAEPAVVLDYPPRAQSWRMVIILLMLYILSQLDRNVIALLVEPMKRDLALSDAQMSLLMGPAFAIFYAIGGLPLGWAIDKFDRRRVICAGIIFWSLATTACGLFRNYTTLFVARSCVGAGEAVLVPGTQSLIADSFPKDKMALPLSVYSTGSKVGAGLSFVIVGFLSGFINPGATYNILGVVEAAGWQLIFAAVGLPGVLLAFSIFLTTEPRRFHIAGSAEAKYGYLEYFTLMKGKVRFFVGHHLGALLVFVVISAIQAWTPAFLVRVHNWPTDQVGLWLGVVIMAGPLISMPIFGALVDFLVGRGHAHAHMLLLLLATLLSTPVFVAGYLVSNAWLGLALIGVGMTLLAGYVVLLPAALQSVVPSQTRGKAASVFLLLSGMSGLTIGPVLVASVSTYLIGNEMKIGWSLALCIGICLPIAAALFGLSLKPLKQGPST